MPINETVEPPLGGFTAAETTATKALAAKQAELLAVADATTQSGGAVTDLAVNGSGLVSQLAGKQPGSVVIFDAAITGTVQSVGSVERPLSSAKRYRIFGTLYDNGVNETIGLNPDGVSTGCFSYVLANDGTWYYAPNLLRVMNYVTGFAKRWFSIVLEPRRDGVSSFHAESGVVGAADWELENRLSVGSTTTDFTTLALLISVGSRDGWLTVIEETLAVGDPATGPADNGFFLPDVSNDFDPTVAPGLAGRCGAKVGTLDGTKAWMHGVPVADKNTPDTNWVLVE